MNKINRSIVKLQARQLIKKKWFLIFIVTGLVFTLLQSSTIFTQDITFVSPVTKFSEQVEDFANGLAKEHNDDASDFENFDGASDFEAFGSDENDINSFNFKDYLNRYESGNSHNNAVTKAAHKSSIFNLLSVIFAPLLVTLTGVYLSIIRKPEQEFMLGSEIVNIFKKSFNETYINKLVLVLLRNLFTVLLSFLLFIPGIIYHYSTYFAYQILEDNPDMKPSEAAKLSRQMVRGHRGELFVLNLSFFWWYVLIAITGGIAMIYVIPYVLTTDALYYENFRIRALQNGVILESDFKRVTEPEYADGTQTPQNNNYYSYANPHGDMSGYYYNPTDKAPDTEYPTAEPENEVAPESAIDIQPSETNSYYQPPSDYYTPTDNQE